MLNRHPTVAAQERGEARAQGWHQGSALIHGGMGVCVCGGGAGAQSFLTAPRWLPMAAMKIYGFNQAPDR